jgi:hypothetical protein
MSSSWPDNSGLHFDLSPTNYASSTRDEHIQEREPFYGAKYPVVEPSGWSEWGSWVHKIQPDQRFAAISDTNAWLNGFPEIESPWKFTDYTYKGVDGGVEIIEPPLYSPTTLAQVNLSPSGEFLHATVPGEPLDLIDASGDYKFSYESESTGVKMYAKRVQVECVDSGEHGNIPPNMVTMTAPSGYMEPDNIYTSTIVPRVTATLGEPLMNVSEGVIDFTSGPLWRGLNKITLSPVDPAEFVSVLNTGTRFEEWSFASMLPEVAQGTPSMDRAAVMGVKFIGSDYIDADWVHNGCTFWDGNEDSTCRCSLASQLSETDAPNVPDPVLCPSYTYPNPQQEYIAASGLCPWYQPKGPHQIGLYEFTATKASEWAEMYSTIDNYDAGGGGNNLTNAGAMFSASNSPMGGGTLAYGGYSLGAGSLFKNNIDLPRAMSDTNLRSSVEYEFKKIPSNAREVFKERFGNRMITDYDQFKPGTGRFSLDKKDTNYSGIDENFFNSRNALSAWRWNNSAMPCYESDKCNVAYGPTMSHELEPRKYSGVNDHCGYYDESCPHIKVPRRAQEYSVNYMSCINKVLKPFRLCGMDIFSSLTEYEVSGEDLISPISASGVFCAAGPSGKFDIDSVYHETIDKHIYFYYDKASSTDDHTSSDVFCFITQYDHNDARVYMDDPSPSGYPDDIDWLVKMEDDYEPPTEFLAYVTNEKRFFGGRFPEYKDYSKMNKDEVLAVAAQGGGTEETTNGGQGGDLEHTIHDKGYYRGYWRDKTGEYIVDGRALGNVAPSGYVPPVEYVLDPSGVLPFELPLPAHRVSKYPPHSNGATPIAGVLGNSVISADRTFGIEIKKLPVYSSDTRDALEEIEYVNEISDNTVYPAAVPSGQLPTERTMYRCPSCSWETYNDDIGPYESNPQDFPSVDQIFTDFEAEDLDYQCPVCDDALGNQGSWTHFPNVHARGIVTIFGYPGQTVRKDGYYWSHPTTIDRTFVGQIKRKLGDVDEATKKYKLDSTSASLASESATDTLIRPSGSLWKLGPGPSGVYESRFDDMPDPLVNYSHNDLLKADNASHMTDAISGKRMDGGEYVDNVVSAFDSNTDGLDMITITSMKELRDAIQPLYGYRIGADITKDFYDKKQPSHKDRYGKTIKRDHPLKPGTLPPQILAANNTGRDQRSEYWDGTFPGTNVYEYYPTGPTWWRINQYMGGITRKGGTNRTHLDNVDDTEYFLETHYTGNDIRSNAFFFLHGYLPLDKEVERAYALICPQTHPEKPPIGVTWSGSKRYWHYHAFPTNHEDAIHGPHYYDDLVPDSDTSIIIKNLDAYEPSSTSKFTTHMEFSKGLMDNSAGMNYDDISWGETLSWEGIGEDLVQTSLDSSLWKRFSKEGFEDLVEAHTLDCDIMMDDDVMYNFKMMSKPMLDKVLAYDMQNSAGQFDLSGMNDKLLYPESPIINSYDIEEFGDKILSGYGNRSSAGLGSDTSEDAWSSGGYGKTSSGWECRVVDITDSIKEKYDARLTRYFSIDTGMNFEELRAHNEDELQDLPSEAANDKFWSDDYGIILNDSEHFPQLIDDEFPEKANGDEYFLEPSGRISDVTSYHSEHHPYNVLTNNVSDEPSGYWLNLGDSGIDQHFDCDLRQFPIEEFRRDWRHQKGHWNTSSVVCPNKDCIIGHRDMTMSEFAEFARTTGRSTKIPNLLMTTCPVSGDSLIDPPASGAVVVGGDGIDTFGYLDHFDNDMFISAIQCQPMPASGAYTDSYQNFSIETKADSSSTWRTLFSVSRVEDKWHVPEYDSNNELTTLELDTLPSEFTGAWVNGEQITETASLSGYNFMIPRCRYVRFKSSPVAKTLYFPDELGDPTSPTYDGASYDIPYDLEEDFWQGGTMEFSDDFDLSINSSTIGANTESKVTCTEVSPSGSLWRLKRDVWVSSCGKMNVFGYRSDGDDITVSGDAETFVSPMSVGSNQIYLGVHPTKIMSVWSGKYNSATIPMSETESIHNDDFLWQTKTLSNGLERVTSGKYVFDPDTLSIITPTRYENTLDDSIGGSIWSMNYGYDKALLVSEEIPQFIEVRYITGAGKEIVVDCEAIEDGPSYQLEKDSVCFIAHHEWDDSTPSDSPEKGGELPDMGLSAKRNDLLDSKQDLKWHVYNSSPLTGEFSMKHIVGNELPQAGWSYADMAELFGGETQENPGSSKIKGRVSGEVNLYGLPNTLISGDMWVYAKDITKRETATKDGPVLTWERTGGLKYTGFSIGVKLKPIKSASGRKGICFDIPKVLVYLKERDIKDAL